MTRNRRARTALPEEQSASRNITDADAEAIGKATALHSRRPYFPEETERQRERREREEKEDRQQYHEAVERPQRKRREAHEKKVAADTKAKRDRTSAPSSYELGQRVESDRRDAEKVALARVLSLDEAETTKAVATAHAEVVAAEQRVADEQAKQSRFNAQIRELHEKIADEKSKVKEAAVAALEADKPEPNLARVRSRISKFEEKIEQLELVSGSAEQRVKAVQPDVAVAKAKLGDAVLDYTASRHEHAIRGVEAVLAKLGPLFVKMRSVNIVRRRMVGDKFSFTGGGARLFDGELVSKALIEAIPTALSGKLLSEIDLDDQSERAASDLMSEILGEET